MVNTSVQSRLTRRMREAEGFLMQVARLLAERVGQPGYLRPEDLSPHLRRDIGLADGAPPCPRWP